MATACAMPVLSIQLQPSSVECATVVLYGAKTVPSLATW